MNFEKKKKNSNLIIIVGGTVAFILVVGIIFGLLFFGKKDAEPNQDNNLGAQQRQQTNNAVLQLASNLLGNTNNLNQLTKKPDGTTKTIQEIEEEFLISAFNQANRELVLIKPLSSEVIERIWWELRPWIEEYLQDLNRPILEHAQEKFRRDIEKWIKWQQKEYNRQLEEYWKHLQELKRIEDLIAEYQKICEKELLDKINRKTELINKGYIDRDIEKLKEWNLLDQKIPDLTAETRIGATNILYTQGKGQSKIGGSCDLVIFLKPKSTNNSEESIKFSIEIVGNHPQKNYKSYREYYKQIIRDFLTQNGKSDHDAYVLVKLDGSMEGDSAGIAFYLTLYSLINQLPLPRNLGSTGTVEGQEIKSIGGLKTKMKWNIEKEKPINIFILSEMNLNKEGFQKINPGLVTSDPEENWFENFPSSLKEKPKQVHFINQKGQIETALQEILKEPEKKIIHSCGKEEKPIPKPENPNPRGPPQPDNPNSEITSEQLLSLIVELKSKEKENLGNHKDFWEKLKVAYSKYIVFQTVVEKFLNLRQEYLLRLEKINSNPNQRDPDLERQKLVIYKEWQSQFQAIAPSVGDVINGILIGLANLGYNIVEIKWTGELKAPSLTAKPSVNFTIKKS